MNTIQNNKEKLVLSFFLVEKDKWIKSQAIKNKCDIKSGYFLRQIIKTLRIKGNLIIANTSRGYKLIDISNWKSKQELAEYLKNRTQEIKSENRIINQMGRMLYFPNGLFGVKNEK